MRGSPARSSAASIASARMAGAGSVPPAQEAPLRRTAESHVCQRRLPEPAKCRDPEILADEDDPHVLRSEFSPDHDLVHEFDRVVGVMLPHHDRATAF